MQWKTLNCVHIFFISIIIAIRIIHIDWQKRDPKWVIARSLKCYLTDGNVAIELVKHSIQVVLKYTILKSWSIEGQSELLGMVFFKWGTEEYLAQLKFQLKYWAKQLTSQQFYLWPLYLVLVPQIFWLRSFLNSVVFFHAEIQHLKSLTFNQSRRIRKNSWFYCFTYIFVFQ